MGQSDQYKVQKIIKLRIVITILRTPNGDEIDVG